YLYHDGNELDTDSIDVGCVSGTTWNGSKCATPSISMPSVNLSASETSITSGDSVTLTWDSENTKSCSASWTTSTAIYGSKTLYPTSDTTYKITCTNSSGSASDSVKIYVDEEEEETNTESPTVSITATDTNLNYGGSTYISWRSNNADSCTGTNGTSGWVGSKAINGSYYTGSLTDTKSYTIKCTNENGSASDSITIYVDSENNDDDDDDNTNPDVTTKSASDISEDEAELAGNVDMNDFENGIVFFVYGQDENQIEDVENDYDTYSEVDEDDEDLQKEKVDDDLDGDDSYTLEVSGLDTDEKYYYTICVEYENEDNDEKLICGSVRSLTTDEDDEDNDNEEPEVTTYSATEIDSDSATLNGYVDTNGNSTKKWFEWGTKSSSLSKDTTKSSSNSSSRSFESTISNLNSNTTYYFRAVAESSEGKDYGSTKSFTTKGGSSYKNECDSGSCAPTAITNIATNISQSGARLNGLALINGSASTTAYFEYGRNQNLGSSTLQKNIGNIESSNNAFYDGIYNLASNTTYYYRTVVSNQYGTSYGDIISFRTGNSITYTDTNTNTNTVYKNTTVVSNSSKKATTTSTTDAKPSLVSLDIEEENGSENIKIGDMVEYVATYENVSSEDLENVVLQIYIPKEFEFVEASRGYFSSENSTVVANIGNLDSGKKGTVNVTLEVTDEAEVDKIVVVTANLAYTITDTEAQEEVFAYTKNTVKEATTIQQGALALFGSDFLPNNLLGWLLLLLLLTLIVLAVRKAYYGSSPVLVTENTKKGH
ncbi:MAG: hypothetical protein WCX46_04325, partial [Candidatus Paceibacterota bacterium]